MPDSLVETKLLLPRSRPRMVARPRLDDVLLRGGDAALVVISAPAGFGKTTLLGSWAAANAGDRPTAWVSLDERDADSSSFWTYVLLAIDRIAPGAGTGALAQMQSGEAAIGTVLTALVNELSVLPRDLNLVLDDYHLADGPQVQNGMAFLLDHLPPQLHVVISTRADPALPLARLRARGDLIEIRAADLRFTRQEAAAYLNDLNRLGLEPDDVAALERRTEGWAAALQLAALSLQGREDRAEFVAGFAGDDRFVVDYLADEVLDRQPPDVRRFLLDTSVLDRLSGPLCDEVAARTDGRLMLESLERQNLFVVPLDSHRRWYRYHHLFGDVLRAHLLDERPADAAVLHRRASDWYDRAGDPQAAVRHALAAPDARLAAELMERAIPALLRARREAVVRPWIDQLPAHVLTNRPVLAVEFIGALMSSNEFDGVEQRLRDVERLLAAPPKDLVVLDRAEFARLPAAIETYRAALALVERNRPATIEHAELALARAAHDDHLSRAAAAALIGLASWADGDLEAAHSAYRTASDSLARGEYVADVVGCAITLADIELTQGSLAAAQRTLEHALGLADNAEPPLRGAADMLVGLARIAFERGDFAGAADHLGRADALAEAAGLPQNPYRWRVGMARLRAAQGDTRAALDLLVEAERVYVGDFSPNVRPVPAERASVLAASGDAAGALAWARQRALSAGDALSYLHEYEHLTLARALLADHAATGNDVSLTDAAALLDRLLVASEAGHRKGVVIEELALQALVRAAAGEREPALESLARALRLAEPEGWLGVFTSGGVPMKELLQALQARHRRWGFVRRALHVLALTQGTSGAPTTSPRGPDAGSPAGPPGATRPAEHALVEPLSGRELDVLRYLGSDLDGPAIAGALGVSLSTVRTHTQHVYAKLGVDNRRAAVRRAHQLNLFSRTPLR